MSQYLGLNQATEDNLLFGMNFPNNYSAPVDIANNTQTGWQGLVTLGPVDFTTLNPLGFNRGFAFTAGVNIYGYNDMLSMSGAIITPRDQIIINIASKTGVPLSLSELANRNQFVPVSELPAYATPGTPYRPLLVPPIYSNINSLNFSYLDNSAYLPLVS